MLLLLDRAWAKPIYRAKFANDIFITCYWSGRIYNKMGYSRTEFTHDLLLSDIFEAESTTKKSKRGPSFHSSDFSSVEA